MSANVQRKIEAPTPDALTPTPDQFEVLRQTIDALEQQSKPGAQRGEGVTAKPRRAAPGTGRDNSMNTMTQTAPPTTGSNKMTLDQLCDVMESLGAQEAQGKDGQVKADLKAAECAFIGSVDLAKDKHGPGIDDATRLAAAYVKGRNSAVIFDHKEPKQRKLCSNIRTMIKLGGSPKFGVGEPMATLNNLMTIRQNLRKTANKGIKLDDAHNTLMRFAREQLKRDTLISDADELKSFCVRSETDPRTAEDVIKGWLNQATKLKTGKLSNCPELDNSQEITTIINACNRRLSAIAKAKNPNNNQAE